MIQRTFLAFVLLLLSIPGFAQEDDDGPWSGKAKLGYLATSGNTENSTLNSGFELGYSPDQWAHLLSAIAINASENDVTTAEAYELAWKSERSISENNFLFGRLDWRKDRFSSYDSQFAQTVGYGRRVIDSEVHTLNAEVGVGARQSDLLDGTTENEFIVRAGLDYRWILSENSEFTQTFGVEAGDANTFIQSVTAVSAKLRGNLALVASYTVKHNTDVLPLTEKTDTYTALSLEYLF